MKKLLFEMFLIIAFALCISLLYNMFSPSGLRILPKKRPAVGSMHRIDHVPVYAHASSDGGWIR